MNTWPGMLLPLSGGVALWLLLYALLWRWLGLEVRP
jgi:hypothetical protein